MNSEEIAARYGPRITEWLLQWKDYLMALLSDREEEYLKSISQGKLSEGK